MRYKPEHKHKVKAFILDTAGRRLRKEGFDGVGVNGLMEDAGLTTGAFYSHFNSKGELLLEVLKQGLEEVVNRLDARLAGDEPQWLNSALKKYFGSHHCTNVEGGCILPALTVDASRSGEDAKQLYHVMIQQIITRLMQGMQSPLESKARAKAWTILSIMVGAVTIARALPPGKIQDELLSSAFETAKEMNQ